MKELNVYAISADDYKEEMTDKEFINLAEEQGRVYTLAEFQANFNSDWDVPSPTTDYIRIL